MTNEEVLERIYLLRDNLINSAAPNMHRALANQAPIAALVYALALVDAMAGFFFGAEARKKITRGEGVRIRYERFVEQYLSPARSGCDYSALDLYKSLRCNMAHSLTPGHSKRGQYDFELRQDAAIGHSTHKTVRTVFFDVPTFCDDVLAAAHQFLTDVEKAVSQSPEPDILKNFKAWWDEGYSILVSD